MTNKYTTTYWLQNPGEEGSEIKLLETSTTKVPERGEVISIKTDFDQTWAEVRFKNLSEHDRQIFFPKEEVQVKGDFVVVEVKRFLKISYYSKSISEVFGHAPVASPTTSMMDLREIPVGDEIENFEVFVQPFKHSELTETPIAKLRNLLGPIFGTIDILNLTKEHPEKEKELREMFFDSLKTANDTMPKIRELIGNDKNWR